jgi:hypothetical protein
MNTNSLKLRSIECVGTFSFLSCSVYALIFFLLSMKLLLSSCLVIVTGVLAFTAPNSGPQPSNLVQNSARTTSAPTTKLDASIWVQSLTAKFKENNWGECLFLCATTL